MRNMRTRVRELRGADWPTSDQERELHCVRHHTDKVKHRRFDTIIEEWEHRCLNHEAVNVYVTGIVAHHAAVQVLTQAGMTILLDDGIRILYIG